MYPLFVIPKYCSLCGERQRSLILDTRSGTITGFCCLGKRKDAPPLVKFDPRDYNDLNLSLEDQEFLAAMKVRGYSLLELLTVLAVILVLGAICAPTMWDALQTVRELMTMVNQVVVH